MMYDETTIVRELRGRFDDAGFTQQETKDGIPTLWVPLGAVRETLAIPEERGSKAVPRALRPRRN